MAHDPFTLVVALDQSGQAQGLLYMDDGETMAYELGGDAASLRHFSFHDGSFECMDGRLEIGKGGDLTGEMENQIERIVFLGLGRAPEECWISEAGAEPRLVDCYWNEELQVLTVRKPIVKATSNFSLRLFDRTARNAPQSDEL